MTQPYTSDQIERLGHSIIYLAERIPNLSKTKLLKLLFLVEETSVTKYGLPFSNMPFEVWQHGPVQKDVFIDLTNGANAFLDKYISAVKNKLGSEVIITPKIPFSDDEFSDKDMGILALVVEKYRKRTAAQLIKLTHKKESLWYQQAETHGLLEAFEKGLTTSDVQIEFIDSISEDPKKQQMYLDQQEYMAASASLKA